MNVLMLGLVNDLRFDQRVRRAARAMAAAGHGVTAVGVKTWEVAEEEKVGGYTILRLPLGPFPLFPGEETYRHFLRLAAFRPDVVHVHDVHALGLGARLASWCRARLVYDSHELWWAISENDPGRRWTRRVEARAIPRAALVVVPADGLGLELARHYRVRRLLTIRNIPDDVAPVATLSFPVTWPRDRTIAFWGGIKRGRMMAELKSVLLARPELHVVFAGDGPDLLRFTDDPATRDRTHHLGHLTQEELLAVGRTAAIGWCCYTPSVGDTIHYLPNKLFEFLRSGLPILATDLPEMKRVIEETGAGVTIPIDDAEAALAGVNALLSDPARFRPLAEAGGRRYTWAEEARRLVEEYTRF